MWLVALFVVMVIFFANRSEYKKYKEEKAKEYIDFIEEEKMELEELKKKFKAPSRIKSMDQLAKWLAKKH